MRLFLVVVPFVLVGCADLTAGFTTHELRIGGGQGPTIKGSGIVKEESRKVGAFDRVSVGSAFVVYASEGPAGPIAVSADSNLLSHIKTEVRDHELFVTINDSVSTNKAFKLRLSAPTIRSFDASGATKVDLKLRNQHTFSLSDSGASTVNVHGPVGDLTCEITGASRASFDAKNFGKVKLVLSGASSLQSAAIVDSLVAELSGASSLKGGMNGNTADLRLSGASNASVGRFRSVVKETSGASSVHMGQE